MSDFFEIIGAIVCILIGAILMVFVIFALGYGFETMITGEVCKFLISTP